ncbi:MULTISPECIES: GntR family transcriptional regulator [Tessaracoccus]|uniref:GntR family transcriptional regulator n=1 Tax=Tessaracoccus TaxID=72763 RepID=UPI00099CD6E4|nr:MULTISPECIES: GntR family transcriptional regulator [Tessaracoccus]AQX16438.1 GntR family transcriptional regulator [Tessaracoccus sp. T2.5-30]VEP41086.1 HTH-type transcriptional repressor YtrA [Tessaracoccus lapidicaptus]
MTVSLRVDSADPTPPYEQLRRQLAGLIRTGTLASGTRLPTVRQLAQDLGLAPGTVMRTYRELEADGLVASRRVQGTVVTGTVGAVDQRLAVLAASFVKEAGRLGAGPAEIRAAVDVALSRG